MPTLIAVLGWQNSNAKKIFVSGGSKGQLGVDRLGEMGDILRLTHGAQTSSTLIWMEPMLARSFQLLVLVACLFSAANAQAGLVITEVMFNPEGGDVNYEYIELYNAGATEINLSHYELSQSGSLQVFGSLSGQLNPGETIVLFNDDLGSFSNFLWSPSRTIRSLAVKDWRTLQPGLNAPSLTLKEISPVDPANRYEFSIYDFDNSFDDDWPTPAVGMSIYLMDLTSFNPSNWARSDTLVDPLDSENSGIGSPGYQQFPVPPPAAVPEPTSLAVFALLGLGSISVRHRRRRVGTSG
ncbi:lamin tail domain-containing protein [Stieleria sp. ICT_E10.1]|uniref:lamin tail domain-containing protein n=1 Tax=Stieleria sedimenti TaxID=2976331 RepID=UPI00217FF3E3|nr:lamin tail domain-containing protein [Stieleria sedimenti]MCS7466788.1 lamin tail domain-containing protein [Stieleria sedimenti]